MFTFISKVYAAGYSLCVGFLCLLACQATVLGVPLSTGLNDISGTTEIRSGVRQPSVVVPSATMTSAIFSSPGSVSAVDPTKCYRLVSRLSGKVLAISGTAQSDGDKLTQQTDANKLTQGWKFTSAGGTITASRCCQLRKAFRWLVPRRPMMRCWSNGPTGGRSSAVAVGAQC
ncbi:RICIN domain-containing protein [Spirosoma telluris]